jgi:hypothetical protein
VSIWSSGRYLANQRTNPFNQGYTDKDNTWETEENLENCKDQIDSFQKGDKRGDKERKSARVASSNLRANPANDVAVKEEKSNIASSSTPRSSTKRTSSDYDDIRKLNTPAKRAKRAESAKEGSRSY